MFAYTPHYSFVDRTKGSHAVTTYIISPNVLSHYNIDPVIADTFRTYTHTYISRFFSGRTRIPCKSRCRADTRIRHCGGVTTCAIHVLSHLIEYAAYTPQSMMWLFALRAQVARQVAHSAHWAGAWRRLHKIALRWRRHASQAARWADNEAHTWSA